ncbi:hypothetical protein A3D72_01855 [Candidatus Uhrbacteria bacterium RIFCSPHIGHO2_02_FULL_57_19]|uniref:Uncharacterized protein n=1 Tax=Candidatus Uhrbacteria bacterium RIFCSPHIGHO2_02_FULL_57_19 TaxID=1802391 RepID=A0A1F7U430_9BACT|nr:MAG: hypothetical protein A3D72_01855 [Candidatus Uhrbacteria bacterium RIFCSPHIGHO2_02_FULL_57_19]
MAIASIVAQIKCYYFHMGEDALNKKPEKRHSNIKDVVRNTALAGTLLTQGVAIGVGNADAIKDMFSEKKEVRMYSSLDQRTVERERAAFDLVERLDAMFRSGSAYQKEDVETAIAAYLSQNTKEGRGDVKKGVYIEPHPERLATISAEAARKLGDAVIALATLSQAKRVIDPRVAEVLSRTARTASDALVDMSRNPAPQTPQKGDTYGESNASSDFIEPDHPLDDPNESKA